MCGIARGADSAPSPVGVTIRRDLPYLAPDRAETLDLYMPAPTAARARAGAIVWIHGGGWTGGQKWGHRERNVCLAFVAAGYVCVSIDYKLGNGAWPQNLLDCKNAVRFLRTRADEFRIDPNRIAVAGGSAGGHLALMVGLTAGQPELEPREPYANVSSEVRCVIDLYGPTNLLTRKETAKDGTPTGRFRPAGPAAVFGAATAGSDVYALASPVTHVTAKSPPVLILHGRADATVDYHQSTELAGVLKKHGVPHELILLEGVGHTFDLQSWYQNPLPRDLRPVVTEFLARHLR